jgi:hypothetical protein
MQTRSSMKRFEVNIDFDEASSAWRENKRSIGKGCYEYICEAKTTKGKKCKRKSNPGCNFCSHHFKFYYNHII